MRKCTCYGRALNRKWWFLSLIKLFKIYTTWHCDCYGKTLSLINLHCCTACRVIIISTKTNDYYAGTLTRVVVWWKYRERPPPFFWQCDSKEYTFARSASVILFLGLGPTEIVRVVMPQSLPTFPHGFIQGRASSSVKVLRSQWHPTQGPMFAAQLQGAAKWLLRRKVRIAVPLEVTTWTLVALARMLRQ